MPRPSVAELTRALQKDGWQLVRQQGSHAHYQHSTEPGRVTIPQHAGETVRPKLLSLILEQAGLSVEDLRRLL